ncbi:hypothetical protein HanRHA438_Chr17g0807781 [Helianthus annuus]|nr:hypothetical protein HanRHA438_Chr17g0807781 [Helianthus annuus]
MLSCNGETKRGYVLSRTVSFFWVSKPVLNVSAQISWFPDYSIRRQKTKPRGDRVVYTCRVECRICKVGEIGHGPSLLMETQLLKVILYMDGVKEVLLHAEL